MSTNKTRFLPTLWESFDHVRVCCCCSVTQSCLTLWDPPRTIACQPSLPFTISWSLLKLMSIELLMPSNHLILYRPLFLLPSIFSSIRVSLAASIITCSSVNCIYHVLPFDHLHPIPPALVTTNLISFSMCVCVFEV